MCNGLCISSYSPCNGACQPGKINCNGICQVITELKLSSCQFYRSKAAVKSTVDIYLRQCSCTEFQIASGTDSKPRNLSFGKISHTGSCKVKRPKVAVNWRYLRYLSIREILAVPGRNKYPRVTAKPGDPRRLSRIEFPGSCQVYGPS